jgi:CubicO group peptidase (beta-lactamase class C family)
VTAPILWLGLAMVAPSQDTTFAAVARVVQRGIQEGVYPGAVVVVGRRDTILYSAGFGHVTWARAASAPSAGDTRWDLASLTKVVATASAVLVLVDQGKVVLDAPVAQYLPRFTGGGRERVTVRMLLDHTSGLPAYLPLYRLASTRNGALRMLYRQSLRHPPGTVTEYSDLNGILLGLLVEAVSGSPLDRFATQAVFAPLGMTSTAFAPDLPRGVPVAPSRRVGCCAVAGRVNDENAFFLGGVSGHAGLFSTGLDLARFAQTWLRNGAPPAADKPWVSPSVLQQFLERLPGERRALGWDVPTPVEDSGRPSVYGASICACAFGHTGWTGTMLWVDPTADLFMVFLTNRSLEPRIRNSITVLRDLRTRLSEEVLAIARKSD